MKKEMLFIWEDLLKYSNTLSKRYLINMCTITDESATYYTTKEVHIEFLDDVITVAANNFYLEFNSDAITEVKTNVTNFSKEYCFVLNDTKIYITIMENRFSEKEILKS